jgi:D-alanyl-D-alanine dipeptidase
VVTWRVDPDGLHPKFLADVNKLLHASPYSWTVTSGYRSLEAQAVLWDAYKAGGLRAAPPGKSAHNFGKAVDVALDGDDAKPGLQPDWNTSHEGWKWLFTAIWQHPRLHSGRSFNDADHIEQLGWGKSV